MAKKNQRTATEQAMEQLRIAHKALEPTELTPTTQLAYKRYKKRVRKLGGKIATPEQYARIHSRLKRRRMVKAAVRKKTSVMPDYTTIRTKATERALEEAGITKEKRKRLRGR